MGIGVLARPSRVVRTARGFSKVHMVGPITCPGTNSGLGVRPDIAHGGSCPTVRLAQESVIQTFLHGPDLAKF